MVDNLRNKFLCNGVELDNPTYQDIKNLKSENKGISKKVLLGGLAVLVLGVGISQYKPLREHKRYGRIETQHKIYEINQGILKQYDK